MDLFHCGPLVGSDRPATRHKFPQVVRDPILPVLSIWSGWIQLLGCPRVKGDQGAIAKAVAKDITQSRELRSFLLLGGCWS